MPSYSFSPLITDTNSSWLIFESTKASEIKISIVFNFVFASNTTLSCLFFFFLVIDLYFLIPAVISQTFNPFAELIILIEIPSKEPKPEIETRSVTSETKIRKCSI